MRRFLVAGLAALAVTSSASIAAAHVTVNLGPPIVVQAPPRLVVVPESPVFYAPDVEYNYFVYDHRHWVLRDGRWYVARTYRGPWTVVPVARVPSPVAAVPVAYYKVPPGHAKKIAREEWREHDRGHGRGDWDGDRGHGHGKGKGKHRD